MFLIYGIFSAEVSMPAKIIRCCLTGTSSLLFFFFKKNDQERKCDLGKLSYIRPQSS